MDTLRPKLRHASYYLDVLRRAGELYDSGGEKFKEALIVFNSDSANIIAGQSWAADNSQNHSEATLLCKEYPIVAPDLLDLRQHPQDSIKWLIDALTAARRLNDRTAEGMILNSLASSYIRLGETMRAIDFSKQALAISRELGNRKAEADALINLSVAHYSLGEIHLAIEFSNRVLAISRKLGNRKAEADALINISAAHHSLGEVHLAIEFSIQALIISQKIGNLKGESRGLDNLGQAYHFSKDYNRAIKLYEGALRISRDIEDSRGVISAINNIGKAYSAIGEHQRAIECHQQALIIARELTDLRSECLTLSNIGQVYHLQGDISRAINYYKEALELVRLIEDRRTEVDILMSLGNAFIDLQEFHHAVELHDARIKLMNEINHPPIEVEEASTESASEDMQQAPTPITRTLTWLHLSDLHFSESHSYDQNIVINALIDDVAQMVHKDGLKPDFVVFTGDLAFSGKPSEYILARDFFDKLLEVTGLSNKELFIVPGNHDVDRNLIRLATISLGKDIDNREFSNMILASPGERGLFLERFKGYAEFFNEYFAGHLKFGNHNYYYAHELHLGDMRVAILGLNSAWLAGSDEDEARKVVVGERQAYEALGLVEKANFKIALLHHPFNWIRSFDLSDSADLLYSKCDFILHGHLHEPTAIFRRDPDREAMVIAGGACYATRKYPNSYNFVKLDFQSKTGRIYFRGYSDKQPGFWAKDTMLYRKAPDGVYEFPLAPK